MRIQKGIEVLFVLSVLALPMRSFATFRTLHDFGTDRTAAFSGETVAFRESNHPDRVLVLDANGHFASYSLTGKKVIQTGTLRLNEGCQLTNLRTTQFARPFFLGRKFVCVLDSNTRSISRGPDLALENGTYASVYWGETNDSIRFLLNGRPWPGGAEGSGFVRLLELNKSTRQSTVRPLLIRVPGYSGGMAADSSNVFVTVWKNESEGSSIYSLGTARMREKIKNQETASFLDESTEIASKLSGSTGLLRANSQEFLFDNSTEDGAGESFVVNRNSRVSSNVHFEGCRVIGGEGAEWLLFCKSKLTIGTFL